MAKKKKVHRIEMIVHGVLSYPDLHNPKPFKGKIYYRTDVLLDNDDPQIAALKKKLHKLRVDAFGDDKTEWPDKAKKKFIQDGNEREDQPAYKDKAYITASTQTPVPVVTPNGKPFSAQMVKGGMTAKVAVCLSNWTDPDGEEGVSIYLQGVMIDPSVDRLPGFGGGKSAKQLFNIKDEDEGEDEDSEEDASDEEDDEEDQPRSKKKKPAPKKKRPPVDEEEDDDSDEESEEDEDDYEDEDDMPKAKSKKSSKKTFTDDEDDDY